MKDTRKWQGYWEGRESTRWTDSIKNLRKKLPIFTQEVFCIGAEVNKYKDLIVREPLGEVRGDFGYEEAITRGRIPMAAVSNNYRGRSFRGRKQGYKLVNHHELLDDVFEELARFAPGSSASDIELLEATLLLSIYGARMHIEFLVPLYKRNSHTLKVTCRNSVDGKFALIINLFLYPEGGGRDIPFDGFRHVHTQELQDGTVRTFLFNALNRFLHGTWYTDQVDRDTINRFIDTDRLFTKKERQSVIVELDKDKQARVNLLRFRKILTVLVDEGRDVFRGEHYVKFAKLTEELNKLVDEVEAQQSGSKQTHFFR